MIYVTVGTHEQQFNRLVQTIDELQGNGRINDEVLIQTGFCTYEPKFCEYKSMFSYKELTANMEKARIIITHGGPSSFVQPLQMGKVPIVVPRLKQYKEHVNNHQLDFCRQVSKRYNNIILVEDIDTLENTINYYDSIVGDMPGGMKSNNEAFMKEFIHLIDTL